MNITTGELAQRMGDAESTAPGSTDDGCRLIVRRASEIEKKPVEWLWQSRIELGSLNLIGGDAGSKKSLLSCALAAAVTTGAAWPGDLNGRPPADTLFLPAEDDLSKAVAPRLAAAGADLERVHIVEATEIEKRTLACMLPRDAARLGRLIRQTDAKLCIIDPIKSYVDADTDSNRNEKVRNDLHPLVKVAADTNCAICLISHLNKACTTQPSALYRLAGSLAYVEVARTVSIVVADKDVPGRSVWVPVKINHAARPDALAFSVQTTDDGLPVVLWDKNPVPIDADEALAPKSKKASSVTDEAMEWLESELESGPMSAADVFKKGKEVSFSEPVLRHAYTRLGGKAVPIREAGKISGWEWSLPRRTS
ncbi:MAG: AAA family ATPase [Planctomycetes bacterium]|nr:AAA family ATPase [Planctomycetota bacterium]